MKPGFFVLLAYACCFMLGRLTGYERGHEEGHMEGFREGYNLAKHKRGEENDG